MKEKKKIISLLDKLSKVVEEGKALLDREISEKWNRKYINDLPSAAFAVVEKGYSEGKNKGARHLPHHNKGVKSATARDPAKNACSFSLKLTTNKFSGITPPSNAGNSPDKS